MYPNLFLNGNQLSQHHLLKNPLWFKTWFLSPVYRDWSFLGNVCGQWEHRLFLGQDHMAVITAAGGCVSLSGRSWAPFFMYLGLCFHVLPRGSTKWNLKSSDLVSRPNDYVHLPAGSSLGKSLDRQVSRRRVACCVGFVHLQRKPCSCGRYWKMKSKVLITHRWPCRQL